MFQDFQQEAMNKLSVTAPSLVNGVLRFQDLSEKFTKVTNVKVGVLVLSLPAGAFLIPVISRDDVVMPLDSIYDTASDKFKPLTAAYVQQIMAMQGTRMGSPQRIPSHVNVNPSIYNMIVPPRTGKYAYASSGLEDFLAQAPAPLVNRFKVALMANKSVAAGLNQIIDLDDVLSRPAAGVAQPVSTAASVAGVEVLTRANDINPVELAVIRDILRCGYHIKGDIQEPRPAVELASGHEGLIQVSGAVEGMAYRALRKDGSSVNCMVLKRAPRLYGSDLPSRKQMVRGGFMTGDGKAEKADDGGYLLITEYGGWCPNGNVVLHKNPIELSDVAKEMYTQGKVRDLRSINNQDVFVLLTNRGALGPFRACSVTHTDSMVILNCRQPYGSSFYDSMTQNGEVVITASTGYSGEYYAEPGRILIGMGRSAIVLGHRDDESLEDSIASAHMHMELKVRGELCDSLEISNHGHGFFSLNGRQLSEPELAEMLVIGNQLGKQASLGFIKSAKEKGRITVVMQKRAVDMSATPVGEIPEYGQMPPQEEMTNFNLNAINDAINTQYPDIVEGAVMVQFLQDPTMYSTISSYIPTMVDCVDRIGRTLLLLRLHMDTTAPDQTSGVVTSLRNTYTQVGDSVLKLEQMVNSYVSDGIPTQNRI
jgi:hypothetical protein